MDWYQPTQLLSTLTSRSIFIISSWNSWPSKAAASSSAFAASSADLTTSPLSSSGSGNGNACVISSTPSSIMRPRSEPVTIVGSDSLQCLIILRAARPSSFTEVTGAFVSITAAMVDVYLFRRYLFFGGKIFI